MDPVDITLTYFDGCPNWQVAAARLREALDAVGRPDAAIKMHKVETPEEAERLGFHGSPTVLIGGRDPFAEPDAPVGLMCRVYRTEHGLAGAPSVPQLEAALRATVDN